MLAGMLPLSLTLRGLTRFDEPVTLDLSGLSGMVAITGDHGEGKTTLLDALGGIPLYRRMSTRPGRLREWCTRRDSRIELAARCRGRDWRMVLAVDPRGRGGEGEERAVLYEDGTATGGGNVTDYDAAIASRFPPRSVFLASAFGAQNRGGSFLALDVPERKRLFGVLLGLGELEDLAARAGARRRALDDDLDRVDAAVATTRADGVALADLDDAIARAAVRLGEALAALGTATVEADRLGAEAAALHTAAEVAVAAWRDLAERRRRAEREVTEARATLARAEEELACPVLPLPDLDALRATRDAAAADLTLALARETEREVAARRRDLAAERHVDATRRAALLGSVPCGGRRALLEIDEEGAEDEDGGDGALVDCGACAFLSEARDAAASLPGTAARLADAEANLAHLPVGAAPAPLKRAAAATGLAWAAADRGAEAARHQAARRPLLEQARDAARERLQRANASLAEAPEGSDPATRQNAAQRAREAADSARRLRAVAEAEAQVARDALATLRGRRAQLGDVAARLAELGTRRAELARRHAGHVLVEAAFGRDGIPALEIDAAGPEVSALCNDLLETCFGGRFAVRLRTLRPAEGRRDAREVFDLTVLDGLRGRSGGWDALSGGEGALIDEALKLALAVFNARMHPSTFDTLYRDEPDAGLSPSMAALYPAMLRRACALGGFTLALVTSHREECWGLADARLHVAGGSVARC